jgi:hypothetical protein
MQSHQRLGATAARPTLDEQEQAQLLAPPVDVFAVETFFLFSGTVVVVVPVANGFEAPSSFDLAIRTFVDGASVFSPIFTLAYAKL